MKMATPNEMVEAWKKRMKEKGGGGSLESAAKSGELPTVESSGPSRKYNPNAPGEISDEDKEGWLMKKLYDMYHGGKKKEKKKRETFHGEEVPEGIYSDKGEWKAKGELHFGPRGTYLNNKRLSPMWARELGYLSRNDVTEIAVQQGIGSILKSHPYFARGKKGGEFVKYLVDHLDHRAISQMYSSMGGEDPEEKIAKLSRYIANGGAFDNLGQRLLLKKGFVAKGKDLEGKVGFNPSKSLLRFVPFSKTRKYAQDEATTKYLNKAIEGFGELYHFFSSVETPQSLAPIQNAVEEVYSAGLMEAAAGLLFEKDLLDNKKYREIRKMAKESMQHGTKYVTSNITDYLGRVGERLAPAAQKIAATLFGISGLGILVSTGLKLTGNAVGNSSSLNIGLSVVAGVLLLVIAVLLFKLKRKKKNKFIEKKVSKKGQRKKRR